MDLLIIFQFKAGVTQEDTELKDVNCPHAKGVCPRF